jgi:glucose-1-phosphate adenylyltransferase
LSTLAKNVVAVVLGGGRGTRLQPLTGFRAKPAVPLAGKYRLIDIPLSNCINSGISQIFVLTQFQSVSLHAHIRGTYRFDQFNGGFVEVLPAQQTLSDAGEQQDWYQGTADAVRKNLRYLLESEANYFLILSGDQLYRMDFRAMIATHKVAQADVTIAAKPVGRAAASALGIMRVDDTGRVVGFLEKPQTASELDNMATDPAWINAHGIDSHGRDCLASLGIYLFHRDTLVDVLEKTNYHDFGREVFPASIRSRHVQLHMFDGYWEDIGTIRSFYEANLMLAQPNPPFELASATAPIYTRTRSLPPTRADGVTIERSLVADGCVIGARTKIENSVIGLRCRIGSDVTIRNSVIMGADYYESPGQLTADRTEGRPPIGIGAGAFIDGAIVDKNCHIGAGARVTARRERLLDDGPVGEHCTIRDGIIVVAKNGVVPENWHA